MEEAAVEYGPGGPGEKTSPAQRWGKNTFQRMIHVASTERSGRRTIWGLAHVSFASVDGKMMKHLL